MLVKLSLGVNLINTLHAAFTSADPETPKKTDDLTVFFVLLGSAHAKGAHKALVKSTLGLNFISVSYKDFIRKDFIRASLKCKRDIHFTPFVICS